MDQYRFSPFFVWHQNSYTRGHHLKLNIRRAKTLARAKFFSNRVVAAWNRLPLEVVSAGSTNEFENVA